METAIRTMTAPALWSVVWTTAPATPPVLETAAWLLPLTQNEGGASQPLLDLSLLPPLV